MGWEQEYSPPPPPPPSLSPLPFQHTAHTQAYIFGMVPGWLFDLVLRMSLQGLKEERMKKAKQS